MNLISYRLFFFSDRDFITDYEEEKEESITPVDDTNDVDNDDDICVIIVNVDPAY